MSTYSGISRRELDYARAKGRLAYFKVGRRVLYSRADLDEFMRRHRVETDEPANSS